MRVCRQLSLPDTYGSSYNGQSRRDFSPVHFRRRRYSQYDVGERRNDLIGTEMRWWGDWRKQNKAIVFEGSRTSIIDHADSLWDSTLQL